MLKKGQTWVSPSERFEILNIDGRRMVVVLGVSEIKFLNLKVGAIGEVSEKDLQSFLTDEMKGFNLIV